ncbi:MAG: DUF896 domain-containing protein [Bacillota bacterium]|nr:DUF896 domain-containing protein [Bacillota bacterium]
MEIDNLVERINFLYHKSKNEGLTLEEIEEQKTLRNKYINNVKNNFRSQLQGIKNNKTKN